MTEQDVLWFLAWCLVGAIAGRMLVYPLFHWNMERIKRKVKREMAQREGLSLDFVNETIENTDRLVSGKITEQGFCEQALRIASKYPEDTQVLLSREERLEGERRKKR